MAVGNFATMTGLGPGERRILYLVDDERTIEEIREQTHSTEFQASKILFDQYQARPAEAREAAGGGGAAAGGAGGVADRRPPSWMPAGATWRKAIQAALRHLRAARALDPDEPEALSALRQAEKKIREEIEKAGVMLGSIPQLDGHDGAAHRLEALSSRGVHADPGHGGYDIQSILKITPMPQLDALMVFWKLSGAGYIRLLPRRTRAAGPLESPARCRGSPALPDAGGSSRVNSPQGDSLMKNRCVWIGTFCLLVALLGSAPAWSQGPSFNGLYTLVDAETGTESLIRLEHRPVPDPTYGS